MIRTLLVASALLLAGCTQPNAVIETVEIPVVVITIDYNLTFESGEVNDVYIGERRFSSCSVVNLDDGVQFYWRNADELPQNLVITKRGQTSSDWVLQRNGDLDWEWPYWRDANVTVLHSTFRSNLVVDELEFVGDLVVIGGRAVEAGGPPVTMPAYEYDVEGTWHGGTHTYRVVETWHVEHLGNVAVNLVGERPPCV